MIFIGYIILILVISVWVRRFIPAEGFLIDDRIKDLTLFGDRNEKILYALDNNQIANKIRVEKKSSQEEQENSIDYGVNLSDIKAKENHEVNTDYIYGNFDDSDESLEDVVNRGLNTESRGQL